MKKISIKVPKINTIKESEDERKERLKYWRCTTTKVKESKKLYNRKNCQNLLILSSRYFII